MSWHKNNAIRRQNRFAKYKAHIYQSIGADRTLCGKHYNDVNVYIDSDERHNMENNVCKNCKRIADKLND